MNVTMNRFFASVALATMASAALLVPQSAQAARTIWLQRAQQEQLAASVSPADPEAQEFLQLLGIEVSSSDAIWSDHNFADLVTKYKEARALGLNLVGDLGKLMLMAFDLQDIGARITDERFQEFFALSEEDKVMQTQLREEIQTSLDAFRSDPQSFLEEFLSGFNEGYSILEEYDHYDEYYDESAPYAYGYADPYGYVETGRVVWLFDDSYNPLDSDMTIYWTQIGGPDVTWLTTDSDRDVAFIMPSFDGWEYESYLTFEVTADNGYSQNTYTVYVDWQASYEEGNEVAAIFYEVMGYEIDESRLQYWQGEYDNGMSLEQIRRHFELYYEYEEYYYDDEDEYYEEEYAYEGEI